MTKPLVQKSMIDLPFVKYDVVIKDDLWDDKHWESDLEQKSISVAVGATIRANNNFDASNSFIHEILHAGLYEYWITHNSKPQISDELDETICTVLANVISHNIEVIIDTHNMFKKANIISTWNLHKKK